VALVAPVDGPPRLYARHFLGSIHGTQVKDVLKYFRRRIGQPLAVLWDHLPAHQAKLVQDFVAAHGEDYHLEWLPAYAPELNPEELCNGAVKHELLNAAPASAAELRHRVRQSFVRLGRQPDRLAGFFRHAGLPVNQSRCRSLTPCGTPLCEREHLARIGGPEDTEGLSRPQAQEPPMSAAYADLVTYVQDLAPTGCALSSCSGRLRRAPP